MKLRNSNFQLKQKTKTVAPNCVKGNGYSPPVGKPLYRVLIFYLSHAECFNEKQYNNAIVIGNWLLLFKFHYFLQFPFLQRGSQQWWLQPRSRVKQSNTVYSNDVFFVEYHTIATLTSHLLLSFLVMYLSNCFFLHTFLISDLYLRTPSPLKTSQILKTVCSRSPGHCTLGVAFLKSLLVKTGSEEIFMYH